MADEAVKTDPATCPGCLRPLNVCQSFRCYMRGKGIERMFTFLQDLPDGLLPVYDEKDPKK